MTDLIDIKRFITPPIGYTPNKVDSEEYLNARKIMSVEDSYSLLKTIEQIKNNTVEASPESVTSQKRNLYAVFVDRIKSLIFGFVIYLIASQSHYLFGIAYCIYFLREQILSLFRFGTVFKMVAPSLKFKDLVLHKIAYLLLHLLVIFIVLYTINKKGYLPIHLADYTSLFSKKFYKYHTIVS